MIDRKEYNKEWERLHKKERDAYRLEWAKTHRDTCNRGARALYAKVRKHIINYYGGKCACCGESNIKFLTIDHINNDGYKNKQPSGNRRRGTSLYYWIIKNNYPDNLQVLCWNCNNGKATNGGICPHKENICQ